MDFFQANWLWLLLGVVALWLFLTRAGRGCGVGRREPDRQGGRTPGNQNEPPHDHQRLTGDTDKDEARRTREAGGAAHSGHRGC